MLMELICTGYGYMLEDLVRYVLDNTACTFLSERLRSYAAN